MHRTLLNVLLAFCGEHPRFPHPFLDQGYVDDVIVECEMRNQDREEVQFDMILNSQGAGIVLLLEIKGAIGHDEAHERFDDQRRRYGRVTADNIAEQSGVSLPDNGRIQFDIGYCCPRDVVELVTDELEADGREVVVAFDLKRLGCSNALQSCQVAGNRFQDSSLNTALDIRCDPPIHIPDHYFPFDENTHLLEVVFEVMPYIRTLYADESREVFEHAKLAERAIRVWPYLSREYRTSLGTVVRRVVQAISNAPGDPRFHWDNDERAWRFDESPGERAGKTPPRLNKPAREYLANRWNVDQIDAFFNE